MIRKGGEHAAEELKRCIKSDVVVCAEIIYGDDRFTEDDDVLIAKLKQGFTPEEEEIFWNTLDFSYDNGYGGQELFGTVWLENGAWLTRGEYDGSEWWEYHKYPEIPHELKSLKRILKKV